MLKKVENIPSSPGVYIMKNSRRDVLYVGKAKHLRHRVRSYFHNSASLDPRKSSMVREIDDIDYIVTENEIEALALEANLIKKYKPKYNIILRDDKNYPYLKLTINEKWPHIELTRRVVDDGSLYFGPYIPSSVAKENLAFIRRNFMIRHCKKRIDKPTRPCIQYQMSRCLAPCSGRLEHSTYMGVVEDVKLFLRGEKKRLLDRLREEMYRLAEDERFEEAAVIRDRLKSIEKGWLSQRVILPEFSSDIDIIGFYREKEEASFTVFFLRNSLLLGKKNFFFDDTKGLSDEDLMRSFLEQLYDETLVPSPEVLIPFKIDTGLIKTWLSNKRGKDVSIVVPSRGKKYELITLANENALVFYKKHREEKVDEVLIELRRLLGLKKIPRVIEAVDISNISGKDAVGSVVVWQDRAFIKHHYRHFKIRSVKGSNDYAMLKEVVYRHLKRVIEEGRPLADMLLIDGGKGQLDAVNSVVRELGLSIELVAIAKKRRERYDRVYMLGMNKPIILKSGDKSTHLLQRIRDEAHRFAITYHKKLRAKRTISSPLEEIRGIGKKRRLMLLKKFGGLDGIRRATVEEIASVGAIGVSLAEKIKEAIT